jgi:hypothetical protein
MQQMTRLTTPARGRRVMSQISWRARFASIFKSAIFVWIRISFVALLVVHRVEANGRPPIVASQAVVHLKFLRTLPSGQSPAEYTRRSRKPFTPSCQASSIRLPVSLNSGRSDILLRTRRTTSATESLMRSSISDCLRRGTPKVAVMNFDRLFPGVHVFLPPNEIPRGVVLVASVHARG